MSTGHLFFGFPKFLEKAADQPYVSLDGLSCIPGNNLLLSLFYRPIGMVFVKTELAVPAKFIDDSN